MGGRIHKERAQPGSRKQFGLLEKKKDYRLRARDYHKKRKVIKHLRSEARLRNPDEFDFKMIHSRVDDDGKVIYLDPERRKQTPKDKAARKLKHVNYLRHKIKSETHKVEQLKEGLHFLGAESNTRKVFEGDTEVHEPVAVQEPDLFELEQRIDRKEALEKILHSTERKHRLDPNVRFSNGKQFRVRNK